MRKASKLLLIVILAAVLRFSYLAYNPPSLNWDEVSHGYNAYSILKTGADQWGQKFPILNFRAYGDYPTPLNLYLTIPFILVFGLTEIAIRFPHALLGTLTVISVYCLALGATKRKDVSLLSAFLAAVGPWYLFTSRFVIQSNLSVFLLTSAGAFFVNREKSKYFLPAALLMIFLSLFSYHTTRIFSPIFLIGCALIFRKEVGSKLFYFLVAAFVGLSVWILARPASYARGNVLFLIDQSAINRIIENRNASRLPDFAKRLVYNRPVYFLERFSKNYISYFSPDFLFLKGGTQYQFSAPGFGFIYSICLPFFYIGMFLFVLSAVKEKNFRFLLLWILLAPIPASLTNESFAVLRATAMLPITEIAIATGFYFLADKLFKRFYFGGLLIFMFAVAISAENYLTSYFTEYRKNFSWSWQYGYKEIVNYAKDNYQKYDKIVITKKYGEPHEYFLFFMKWDPAKYVADKNAIKFFQSNWYWVDRFDKFYFAND